MLYLAWKKLSILSYRSIIDVGLVRVDSQLPCKASNKHQHHYGAVHCYSSMFTANEPTPPLILYLQGVYLVLFLFDDNYSPKTKDSHLLHAHPQSYLDSITFSVLDAYYGWMLWAPLLIGGHLMPQCILFE